VGPTCQVFLLQRTMRIGHSSSVMASVGEEARHWGWGWAAMAASAHRPPCQATHRRSQIGRGGPLRTGYHEIPQRRRRGRGQERRATEQRSGRLEGTNAATILKGFAA
jgi:hypothetical protein